MIGLERLFDHCMYAVRLVDRRVVIDPARYYDNGDFISLIAEQEEQFLSIYLTGHMQVEKNELHCVLPQQYKRLVCGLSLNDGVPFIEEQAL